MSPIGFGATTGVVLLLIFQRRLPREKVFEFAIMGTGGFLVLAACFTALFPAALAIGLVGACAGTSYVTGFTTLQENVHDELRGRTFATLYTVIRLCLLISLVVSPLWADFWGWVVDLFTDNRTVTLMGASYTFPGARLALWGGGLITLAAGIWARHTMLAAHREEGTRPPNEEVPSPAAGTSTEESE